MTITKSDAIDNKKQQEEYDKIYYARDSVDLKWRYYSFWTNEEIVPEIPDLKKEPGKKPYGDNLFIKSKYPIGYIDNSNLCTRIFKDAVRFYPDILPDTLKATIDQFPQMDTPKFYGLENINVPIIPSGTYIEILETYTHRRKIKPSESQKKKKAEEIFYWYVLCKIKVSNDIALNTSNIVNQADIDNKLTVKGISRGLEGYIWHTFMSDSIPNSNSNVGYTYRPGTSGPTQIQRAVMDFQNHSIPFPSKENPQVKINFYTDTLGRCKANSLNKIKKTKIELFNALYNAGVAAGVPEINIGTLDYGTGESHPEGRACDIASIKPSGYKKPVYYTLNYTQDDGINQPTIHKAIEQFENAFMLQPDVSVIWGPWFFHEKNVATKSNMIGLYPEIAAWPEKEYYKDYQKFVIDYVRKLIESVIEIKGKMVSGWTKIENGVEVDDLVTNEDKWHKIITDHFIHRHHGHYAIKK